MAHGTIIYLNGTSSAGKTSIALALQDILDEPYLHFSVNTFDQLPSRRQIRRGIYPDIITLQEGFTHCIAALAATGNNVIVDDILSEPHSLPEGQELTARDLLKQRVMTLVAYDVCYVKVYCPLEELERREQARGDRIIGLARPQFDQVHKHSQFDVEVDTSQQSSESCARHILEKRAQRPQPSAFCRMQEWFTQS